MRTFSYSVESKWMSPYTNAGVSGNEGSNTIWCVVDLPDPYVVYKVNKGNKKITKLRKSTSGICALVSKIVCQGIRNDGA